MTLPLSKLGLITALVITALPLAGDYYTNTIVSGSPNTTMIGNQIELFLLQGPLKNFGAVLVLLLSLRPDVLHGLLPGPDPAREQGLPMTPPWRNPWRKPVRARDLHLALHPVVAPARR